MGHIAMPGDMKKWTRRNRCISKCDHDKKANTAELTHSACVLKGGYCKDDDCDKNAKKQVKDTQNNAHGCADTGQPELNEQGMMNRGDPEPYRSAWSGYPLHWYGKAYHRYPYQSAMKELFTWKNIWGTDDNRHNDTDTSKCSNCGNKNAHNPLLDPLWGKGVHSRRWFRYHDIDSRPCRCHWWST